MPSDLVESISCSLSILAYFGSLKNLGTES
jgi:hypothetical protein